jgi:iron complex outermembrane receptor protein
VTPGSEYTNVTRSWEDVTYKLNARYQFTPDNMIYFDHSTGFKSGGFAFGRQPIYEPETVKAYEIGAKNAFFDKRLRLNLSAWHYDYSGFMANAQEFYADPTSVTGVGGSLTTVNAEKTTFDGQSIQLTWLLTDNDIIDFNASHVQGTYEKFDLRGFYAFALARNLLGPDVTPELLNYSGSKITGSPDWSANASYTHTFQVMGGDLAVQGALHYTGERVAGNTPLQVNSYFILPS